MYCSSLHASRMLQQESEIEWVANVRKAYSVKQRDGVLTIVGRGRGLVGPWKRMSIGPLKDRLPLREGCRLQRHWPENGKERWQVWCPKAADELVAASQTRTGPNSLRQVLDWAWARHSAWFSAASSHH